MTAPVTNLSFYRFVDLPDPEAWRSELEALCSKVELKGTIILAQEGINAMLAGDARAAEAFVEGLTAMEPFADIVPRVSHSEDVPFGKLVVKVKPEIVTMRVDGVEPARRTATHLPPEEFREWLRRGEEMVVIDTRNDYEVQLGTFHGAVNPDTDAFHEFPDFVRQNREELSERKVVMFCTGGIRCEKATSWMLDEFDHAEIHQLEGGVLNYFERVEDAEIDWDGELFVFDHRVAVDTDIEPTTSVLCEECGAPVRSGTDPICGCLDG